MAAAEHVLLGFSNALAFVTAAMDITSHVGCPAHIRTP
jgi:hypothetical protein